MPKADERQTLQAILAASPDLAADRPGQILIADRRYYGAQFESALTARQLRLLRPARKGERERPGARLFKPLRQTIESAIWHNDHTSAPVHRSLTAYDH